MEVIYRNTLIIELETMDLKCETEKLVEILYCGKKVGEHKLDLVVENKVIIELKAVSEFHSTHEAQVISYLKATELRVACYRA